ncbi:hypothetical protein PNH50_18890 (plasmid) [Leisingera aquaemixtae]|uniref:hypothetical protein n=1 Tax=Leisingera aquaemixtae TaxID=1396826 RepID=UPI00398428EB
MDPGGDFVRLLLCADPDQVHTVAQNLQGSPVVELEVGETCGRSPPFHQPAHPAVYAVLTFAPETNLHQFILPPKAVILILGVRRHDTALKGTARFQEPFQALPYCTPIFVGVVELCFDELDLGDSWPFPGAPLRLVPDCTECVRGIEGENPARFELQSCSIRPFQSTGGADLRRENAPLQHAEGRDRISHCFKTKPPAEVRPMAINFVSEWQKTPLNGNYFLGPTPTVGTLDKLPSAFRTTS